MFLFLVSDRSQLDAQISTEDTFSTVSTNGRQQSSHNRASEGGAQDVRVPRGDFHRCDCLPESIGECTRTRACALESGENETETKIKWIKRDLPIVPFQITKLKIDSNPFAKGFRDSSRLTDFDR